jgi:hypothetical protein
MYASFSTSAFSISLSCSPAQRLHLVGFSFNLAGIGGMGGMGSMGAF